MRNVLALKAGLLGLALIIATPAPAAALPCIMFCKPKKDKAKAPETPKDAAAQALAAEDFGISSPTPMPPISPDQYYFRVVIDPKIDTAAMDAIDKSTNNRWRRLGFKDVTGFTVVPVIVLQQNGAAIATTTPEPIIAVGVDTSVAATATQPFSSRTVRRYTTGWTLLGPNQSVSLQLTEVARTDAEWRGLQMSLGPITDVISQFTPISVPTAAPAAIDTVLNKVFGTAAPGARASSAPINFDPLGSGVYAYNVDFRDISSTANSVFGHATVTMEFRKSLGASTIWSQGVPPGEPTPSVLTPGPISAMTLVSPPNPTATLASTDAWTALQDAANTAQPVATRFVTSCETFKAAARTRAGLTRLDANMATLEALAGTIWSQRPDFVGGQCFTANDRASLKASGHPVPDPIVEGGALQLSNEDLNLLGAYLRKASKPNLPLDQAQYDKLVRDGVAPSLIFWPQAPGLELAYEQVAADKALADLRSVNVDRFCCFATVMIIDGDKPPVPSSAKRRMLLLVAPAGGGEPLFYETELSTTQISVTRLGSVSISSASADRTKEGKAAICKGAKEPPPAYLACPVASAGAQ
ncbi:hypothetical protein [Caulobacter sp. LARHSG274]